MSTIEKKIQRNIDLATMNTMAVPAVADYFISVEHVEDISSIAAWARHNALDIFILGGGSNVILPERYHGLVIHPAFKGMDFRDCKNSDDVEVTVGAGETWHTFVADCVSTGYFGLENLALIPGTCGAAPVQNIGAYGVELENIFISLVAFDFHEDKVVIFDKAQCEFSYRDSIFKNAERNRYMILSITLGLSRRARSVIGYPVLAEYFQKQNITSPQPKEIFEAVVNIRSQKLPDPAVIPNSGSFFKNPIVSADNFLQLKKKFPNIVAFDLPSGEKKLAAAWLIESAGWKGKSSDGVSVHDRHALVLTNPNRCTSDRILSVAQEIIRDVYERFDVNLEMEPQTVH